MNNLRVELDKLNAQLRARESHVAHQCSMLTDYQNKLDELRDEHDSVVSDNYIFAGAAIPLSVDFKILSMFDFFRFLNETS